MEIRDSTSDDLDALLDIWLRSVRATHAFLTEEDIQALFPQVRDLAFPNLEVWVLVDDDSLPIGFMGLHGNKMEALFIAPEHCRQGGGRLMVEHARALKGPLLVDVNEQNPQALRFYESQGFVVAARSETDNAGRPFPLLHLREA